MKNINPKNLNPNSKKQYPQNKLLQGSFQSRHKYFVCLKSHILYFQNSQIQEYLNQIGETQPDKGYESFDILVNYLLEFDRCMSKGKQNSNFRIRGHDQLTANQPYQALKEILSQFNYKDANQVCKKFQKMARIVLQLDPGKIPYLEKREQLSIKLTKEQVKYLFSLMCLNLVPPQSYQRPQQFNSRNDNFKHIFTHEKFKTQCIIEYLLRNFDSESDSKSEFILQRQVQTQDIKEILNKKDLFMSSFEIKRDKLSIQEAVGTGKVDFANPYIGGGSLRTGCVQEEIMFLTHPQMLVSILLCEKLQPNQSLIFVGFKKYHQSEGYKQTTGYKGPQNIHYKNLKTNSNVAKEIIIAIDAIDFSKQRQIQQFTQQKIDRELLKAYSGFNCKRQYSDKIATGNWGCGVFKGNASLKFMIQWLACSLAQKKMFYYPFDQQKHFRKHQKFLEILKKQGVSKIHKLLIQEALKIYQSNFPDTDIIQKLKRFYPNVQHSTGKSQKQFPNDKKNKIQQDGEVTCSFFSYFNCLPCFK